MRILHIAAGIPYPLDSGVNLRVYHVLKRVCAHHEVWFLALNEVGADQTGLEHIRTFCREVIVVPFEIGSAFARPLKLVQSLLRGIPIDLRWFQNDAMIERIRTLTKEIEFDAVQIEHPQLMPYLEALPPHLQKRTVLVAHDVDFVKYRRLAQIEQSPPRRFRFWVHSRMMRAWEPRYAARFKSYVTVSDADRAALARRNTALRMEVVPNGVDVQGLKQLPEAESSCPCVLFVGSMSYPPNIDGAIWFCKEILPLVQRVIPNIKVYIVGKDPTREVQALESDRVTVTARVDDVKPYYAACTACVVPIRAGGGTRLKILEAMAFGRAVVSTTIGSEGIGAVDGDNILVADDPPSFADSLVSVLTNQVLRCRLIGGARRLVETKFDWDIITKQMNQIYEGLAES